MRRLIQSKLTSDGSQPDTPILNRLNIEGQTVALGLLWQPAQPQIPLREQARLAQGSGNPLDLVAPFGDGKQFGFASTKDGLTANMLAGASLFDSSNWGDNWLAAFEISDQPTRWWIVAMRDRLVYEDQLCTQETNAKTVFQKSLEAPDWEKVIAPEVWNITGAEYVDLAPSISSYQGVRLRSVNFLPKLLLYAVIVALGALIIHLGWSTVSEFWTRKLDNERQEQILAPVEIEIPWENSPDIHKFTTNCEDKISQLVIPILGWDLQIVECTLVDMNLRLKLRWSHVNGSAAWIKAALREIANIDVRILAGGQLAEVSTTLKLPPSTFHKNRQPLSPEIIENLLRDRFLTLGLDLKMTAHFASPIISSDVNAKPNFGYHLISTVTSAFPSEYAQLLMDMPALIPLSLSYQPKSALWLLKAQIYHPVNLPSKLLQN